MNGSTIGRADAVLLDEITEEAFLANLKQRHEGDKIYTYIGEVLIAINPYRDLGVYGQEVIDSYHGTAIHQREPHIFALAEAAFSGMRRERSDCCIVISGESGAGKTESSKHIMRYVAAISGSSGGGKVARVKDMLLASNPLLEAFGNASTVRNDNSSRFGKYMDIHFDFAHEPVGGHVHNYLLEKARVVQQTAGERNFHFFYQLLAGATAEQLGAVGLEPDRDASKYNYLKSGAARPEDAANYAEVREATERLGFAGGLFEGVVAKLAAVVIHLGQLVFEDGAAAAAGSEQCAVANRSVLGTVAGLLGTEAAALEKALTRRVVAARGEIFESNLTAAAAAHARDALAKALYDRLFTYLVGQVNRALAVDTAAAGGAGAGAATTALGVLDIYGFEIMPSNGFEQFCINFCNEKLQQLFIELVLKRQQEEYAREGVEWIDVQYFDNAAICELVEAPTRGVIAILDEQCAIPNGSDAGFVAHCDTALAGNDRFTTFQMDAKASGCARGVDFKIKHFAGPVVYTTGSWVDRNSDTLFQDLKRLLFSCGSGIPALRDMFPEGGDDIHAVHKNPATAATNFKASMGALVALLATKEPYFVRCIKPNGTKAAGLFEDELVTHQVRYLGLVENLRVRRAGYCARQPYQQFVDRYKMLSPTTWPMCKGDQKGGAEQIIAALHLEGRELAYGKTKLFIKDPRTLYFLEEKREEAIPFLVAKIQAFWRGVLARRYVRRLRAAVMIKRHWRAARGAAFMTQLAAACEGVAARPDLGKDLAWPASDRKTAPLLQLAQRVHGRWRANRIVSKLDANEISEIKKKAVAHGLLAGRRPQWGLQFAWEGNYMAQSPLKAKFGDSMVALFAKFGDSRVIFSSEARLLNQKGKHEDRILAVTDKHVYVLDSKKFKHVAKAPLPLRDVSGFAVSDGEDQAVVFKLAGAGTDLVLGLRGDGVPAEVIAAVAQQAEAVATLSVEVSAVVSITLKGKPQQLTFSESDGPTKFKLSKKDGAQLTTRRQSIVHQQERRGNMVAPAL